MNDKIDYLLTFTGRETVNIELLGDFLDALSSNNDDSDILLDRYDIQSISSASKQAHIIAVEHKGENTAFNAMQKMLSSLCTSEKEIFGLIIHFQMHPEYPFMQLADAMDLLRNTINNDNVTFGTTTDKNLPLDFIRITAVVCETPEKS